MGNENPTSEELRKRFLANQDTLRFKKESDFDQELMNFAMQFHKEQSTQMRDRITELELEAKTAKDEREIMIQAFVKFRKEFEGRTWILDGRGCYPYDDERYKEEVRYIFDSFQEIEKNMWQSIKSKTYEYRNEIEKPLRDRIEELEEVLQYCVNSMKIADEIEFSDEIYKTESALNNKQK